jgi:hypothetical protein
MQVILQLKIETSEQGHTTSSEREKFTLIEGLAQLTLGSFNHAEVHYDDQELYAVNRGTPITAKGAQFSFDGLDELLDHLKSKVGI